MPAGTDGSGCRLKTVTSWPRAASRWLCSLRTREPPPWGSSGETSATIRIRNLATARFLDRRREERRAHEHPPARAGRDEPGQREDAPLHRLERAIASPGQRPIRIPPSRQAVGHLDCLEPRPLEGLTKRPSAEADLA